MTNRRKAKKKRQTNKITKLSHKIEQLLLLRYQLRLKL